MACPVRSAAAQARSGRGPVFLELKTYRWREHCGAGFDNHIGYRTEAEYLAWRERDPIENFERRLKASGEFDVLRHEQFKARVETEIAEAARDAKLMGVKFEIVMHYDLPDGLGTRNIVEIAR